MKPKNQPFPPEKIEAIGRMYAAGSTLREIADAVGCSMGGASAIARKTLGLPRRNIDQGMVPWRAIFAAYQDGRSATAIAAELRSSGIPICADTIRDFLRRRGVRIRPPVEKMDPQEVASVVRMTRRGMSRPQIGKALGLTVNQVDHRRRAALPSRWPVRPIPIDVAEALRMHAGGMTWEQVGKHFGCSRACVIRRVHKLDPGGRMLKGEKGKVSA